MSEQPISPEESLKLIQDMIDKTRRDLAHNHFYFLLWGWLVFIACVAQFVLLDYFHSPYHFLAWQIMWIGIIVSIVYSIRAKKTERVITYVSQFMKILWMGMLFTFIITGFVCAFTTWMDVFPMYMVLYGLGTFVSGWLLKFRPLIIGGIVCWGLAMGEPFLHFDLQILVAALAILVSYIIPGYMLRSRRLKPENQVGIS